MSYDQGICEENPMKVALFFVAALVLSGCGDSSGKPTLPFEIREAQLVDACRTTWGFGLREGLFQSGSARWHPNERMGTIRWLVVLEIAEQPFHICVVDEETSTVLLTDRLDEKPPGF